MLRSIEQGIQEHLYEYLEDDIRNQTWNMFDSSVKGKELWLFGLGEGAVYFIERFAKNYSVVGVLDNDVRKQGNFVREFVGTLVWYGIFPTV